MSSPSPPSSPDIPPQDPTAPLLPSSIGLPPTRDLNCSPSPSPPPNSRRPTDSGLKLPWIPIAAASGACAAFNGVFAKLTTTELTSSWASAIATALGLSPGNALIEFLIRGFFFLSNLAFNALMWALFTTALTRCTSTTRVALINTSSNFILTAFSGWMVFGESLPGLWWVGAAGLVVGNVVIGRRDEDESSKKDEGGGERGREGEGMEMEREEYGIRAGEEFGGDGGEARATSRERSWSGRRRDCYDMFRGRKRVVLGGGERSLGRVGEVEGDGSEEVGGRGEIQGWREGNSNGVRGV